MRAIILRAMYAPRRARAVTGLRAPARLIARWAAALALVLLAALPAASRAAAPHFVVLH